MELDGDIRFPVLGWVEKLAQLHADQPRKEWDLCLTLNASIEWSRAVIDGVCNFLAENFGRSLAFSDQCRGMMGDELHADICAGKCPDLSKRGVDQRQVTRARFADIDGSHGRDRGRSDTRPAAIGTQNGRRPPHTENGCERARGKNFLARK